MVRSVLLGARLHSSLPRRRLWNQTVTRAIAAGVEVPPVRLHDLRHTHATVLLSHRVPIHVVSARLGHASAVVTMTVYAHVLPGSDQEAADQFAALIPYQMGKAA
jgi:integrase